jgi:hypothetical protein
MHGRFAVALLMVVVGCMPNNSAVPTKFPKPGFAPALRMLEGGVFEVVGLGAEDTKTLADLKPDADEWYEVFRVSVDNRSLDGETATAAELPPVIGSFRLTQTGIRFEPRFPLAPGVTYLACFNPEKRINNALKPGRALYVGVSQRFDGPTRPSIPSAIVEQVFPSTNQVPENLLKFYIHFSAPMSRGDVYQYIHLLDAAGKEVDHPFLELGEELWDPQQRRFTLFFDPGRIKRGLKPREEFGPALVEGKDFTLVIDKDWPNAQGVALRESYRKRFHAGPPDDQQPNHKMWKLTAPAAQTRDPLTVRFPKPMDHAMLERVLKVVSAGETTTQIGGVITVKDDETCWQFIPEAPWTPGPYKLVVATDLEDLAGNSIAKPFEVDEFRPIQRQVEAKTVMLSFEVK